MGIGNLEIVLNIQFILERSSWNDRAQYSLGKQLMLELTQIVLFYNQISCFEEDEENQAKANAPPPKKKTPHKKSQRTKTSKQIKTIINLTLEYYLMERRGRDYNTGIQVVNCLRRPYSISWAQISPQDVVCR